MSGAQLLLISEEPFAANAGWSLLVGSKPAGPLLSLSWRRAVFFIDP
jgi:hypothetical protein